MMTEGQFVIHVAHIITDPFNCYTDLEKLYCIKLRYLQMAFHEHELSKDQLDLLARIK